MPTPSRRASISSISPARPAQVTESTENRVVATWAGPCQPIVLTLYGPDGEAVAVPLLPKRALTLAQELLMCGVQAIKAASWDTMYGQGAPERASDLVRRYVE